jgi:hypothetical protein
MPLTPLGAHFLKLGAVICIAKTVKQYGDCPPSPQQLKLIHFRDSRRHKLPRFQQERYMFTPFRGFVKAASNFSVSPPPADDAAGFGTNRVTRYSKRGSPSTDCLKGTNDYL